MSYLLNQGEQPWSSYHEAAQLLDGTDPVFVPVEWDNDHADDRPFPEADRSAVEEALRDLHALGFDWQDVTFAVEVDDRIVWGLEIRSEAVLRVVLGVDPWEGPASRFDVVTVDGRAMFRCRMRPEADRLARIVNQGGESAPDWLKACLPVAVLPYEEEREQG